MKVILIGSTGLVGKEVLKILVSDPTITEIVTPVRSGQSLCSKHKVLIYDFDKNENLVEFKGADVIICTLGTTMKKAKSKENFRKVDYEYPLNFAKIGKANGCIHYILNSAMGASVNSSIFYNKVKGEVEQSIRELSFEKYSILRPGLIGGNREEFRLFERIAVKVFTHIDFLIPKSLKINPAEKIAKAICEEIKKNFKGERILTSEMFL